MIEDELTEGSIETTLEQKKLYAKQSLEFNKKNEIFVDLFSNFINNSEQHSNIESTDDNKNTSDKNTSDKNTDDNNTDDKEQLNCRYCFNNDIERNLIAPCECKGGQKWVHIECLRKWQKSVLLSQSTNPRYRTNIDEKCNVCLSKFKIKPPDRYEMMLKYAGSEMAKLLRPGTFIVSDKTVSDNNLELIEKHKNDKFLVSSMTHWIYGIYLITDVIKSNNNDDSIIGVDFTRPIKELPEEFYTLDKKILNIRYIWKKYDYIKNIPFINIKYFMGGPCNPDIGFGLCILENVKRFNITLPNSTNVPVLDSGDNTIIFGQLDGIVKLIDYYYNNDDKKEKIDLYAFVGFAGWSRTQLLGEISRRHWGLCKTKLSDIVNNNENTDINIWENIWDNIYNSGRTIIATSSEFSDI